MGCNFARFPLARYDPCTRVFVHEGKTCVDKCCSQNRCCHGCCNAFDHTIRFLWHFFIYMPLCYIWTPIRVYFLACVGVYIKRLFTSCCWHCLKAFCCCCAESCSWVRYVDRNFPPEASSLGGWKGKSAEQLERDVVWKPASELTTNDQGRSALFYDGIRPADIAQGSAGECWLLSAFACLAEWPGTLQRNFITKERSLNGCYKLRLYDARLKKFVKIIIDDYIPCDRATGRPIFSHSSGHEMWVLLLEKAFAKLCGSYQSLVGGSSVWAFEALTGDSVVTFRYDPSTAAWTKLKMFHVYSDAFVTSTADHADAATTGNPLQLQLHQPESNQPGLELGGTGRNRGKSSRPGKTGGTAGALQEQLLDIRQVQFKPTAELFDQEKMFAVLESYFIAGALLAAHAAGGTGISDVESNRGGIAQGQQYTVVSLYRVNRKLRMVQLRNPWGKFEWEGAWSDKSEMWDKYPGVARKLRRRERQHERRLGAQHKPTTASASASATATSPPTSPTTSPRSDDSIATTDTSSGQVLTTLGGGEGGEGGVDGKGSKTFWMDFAEFVTYFDHIDVCKRSLGPQNLALDHREEEGCCGPTRGCFYGCFLYYCCCQGCRAVCCARDSNDSTPKRHGPGGGGGAGSGCCCCRDAPCCLV